MQPNLTVLVNGIVQFYYCCFGPFLISEFYFDIYYRYMELTLSLMIDREYVMLKQKWVEHVSGVLETTYPLYVSHLTKSTLTYVYWNIPPCLLHVALFLFWLFCSMQWLNKIAISYAQVILYALSHYVRFVGIVDAMRRA